VLSVHTAGPLAHVVRGSFAWAGKLVRDQGEGLLARSGAQWAHGRLTQDLGPHWDIGVAASALAGSPIRAVRHGYGIELGRRLGHDLWLSGGWNWTGYEDPELTAEEFTRAGAYLRIRAKFDESLLLATGGGRGERGGPRARAHRGAGAGAGMPRGPVRRRARWCAPSPRGSASTTTATSR